MKGSNRTWIILAVLALGVAVLYYLLEVQGIAQNPEEVQVVWRLEAAEVAGIRVTDHRSGAVAAVEKGTEGAWQVTAPVSATADMVTCSSLAYTLAGLPVRRSIEQPPVGELEAYGLVTPTYTIEVSLDDGRRLRLEVGSRYPDGSYYARRPGEQEVLMVADYAVDQVVRIAQEPPVTQPPAPTPGPPVLGPAPQDP